MTDSIITKIGLDTRNFETRLTGIQRAVEGFKKGLSNLPGGNLLSALGIGISAGAIASTVKDLSEYGQTIRNTADALGLTAKELQGFQLAAMDAGVGIDQVSDGLRDFTDKLGQAKNGNKGLRDAFEELGITVDNLSTGDALRAFATALSKVDDQARRVAIANQLMGEAGRRLVPTLVLGGDKLDELADSFERAGRTITDENVAALAKLKLALDEIVQTVRSNGGNLIGWLVRVGVGVGFVAQEIRDSLPAFGGLLSALDMVTGARTRRDLFGIVNRALQQFADIGDQVAGMEERLADARGRGADAARDRAAAEADMQRALEKTQALQDQLDKKKSQLQERRIEAGRMTPGELLALDPATIADNATRARVMGQQANLRLAQQFEAWATQATASGQTEWGTGLRTQAERRRRNLTLLRQPFRGANFDLLAEIDQLQQQINAGRMPEAGRMGIGQPPAVQEQRQQQMQADTRSMASHIKEIAEAARRDGRGLKTLPHMP